MSLSTLILIMADKLKAILETTVTTMIKTLVRESHLKRIVSIILITSGIMSVQMAKSLKVTTSSMVFRYILIEYLEHKLKMAL